jgi:spermidine synthase
MPSGGNLDTHIVTAHGAYDVRDVMYNGRPARVLYSSATHTAQSGVAHDDDSEQLFDYMERFMELVRALLPRRILLIGGGAYVLPKAILEELPDVELTVVEIDDELLRVAQDHFAFEPSRTTYVYAQDGIEFMEQDTHRYDLILLDVFVDSTIPEGFQTARAARLLAARLESEGTLAMNIIASYHGPRSAMLKRQIAAWQPSFINIRLFPAGRDESKWFPENFILTAAKTPQDLSPHIRYTPLELPGSVNELRS